MGQHPCQRFFVRVSTDFGADSRRGRARDGALAHRPRRRGCDSVQKRSTGLQQPAHPSARQRAQRTLGGGWVLDPFAPSRQRRSEARLRQLQVLRDAEDLEQALPALLDTAPAGLDPQRLERQFNRLRAGWQLPANVVVIATRQGPLLFARATWGALKQQLLEQQPDADPKRIGMTGISLGGHFAPRAVAYEPRFASASVWGANHNWAEVQQKRIRREGENPVPHYWAHVFWVFGASDMEDFLEKTEGMNLNGHMDRIKVPFLVTHGEQDRQIGLEYAHQAYEQLTNSPKRELKIFTPREGGVEHVGADNMSYGRDYIADWFADTLGGHTS